MSITYKRENKQDREMDRALFQYTTDDAYNNNPNIAREQHSNIDDRA